MKGFLLLMGISVILFSCGNRNSETEINVENDSIVATEPSQEIAPKDNPTSTGAYRDTIKINYAEHKDLLEILQVLPDSVFSAGSWPKEDRRKLVKFISLNNFTVDTTEMYMNVRLIKPHVIEMQVVDGSWTVSIYKAGQGNYIVLTDTRTSTDDVKAFEYINGTFTNLNFASLHQDPFREMLIRKDDAECWKLVKENAYVFEYSFGEEGVLTISEPSLKKDRLKNCMKGNALDLRFNAQTKRFELSGVSWLEK